MKPFNDLLNYKNIVGLTRELKGQYLYETFQKTNNNILFVTNSLYESNLYMQIIKNYTDKVLLFPMDDFLTSEALALSPELKVNRIETMINSYNNKNIIVTNMMGFLRYLPPQDDFINSKIIIKNNDEYEIKKLIEKLLKIGYEKCSIVNKTGDFAVRGFVIDVFPLNSDNPCRLEYFGDNIESIRIFDVDTQLSYKKIDIITIFPNTEFIVSQDIDFFNIKHRDLTKYITPSSINEYSQGLIFYDDYNVLKKAYISLESEMNDYSISIELDIKTKYMHSFNDIGINGYNFALFDNLQEKDTTVVYNSRDLLPFIPTKDQINERLKNYLKANKKVIICLNNTYKINNLITFLENDKLLLTDENNINDKYINVIKKAIAFGYEIDDYIVIGEKELYNKQNQVNNYYSKFKIGTKIKDIRKLEPGDYVVHLTHGIGKYLGIKVITKNGLKKDYLQLEYKNGDKLYVPVEKIELLSKYSPSGSGVPSLTKLGSIEWEKTKRRVKKKIESIADDLIDLYAKRESIKGFAFDKDNDLQLSFEKSFVYSPTKDQIKVIEEIKKDMEKSTPMDRLLCGDVGFGKTEVAFRAMFKAVLSGKQVAFLCPTTILSSQHYNNAIERFKNFAVEIVLLNRFVSTTELNKIISRLKDGKIDIVIGTHKILNDQVVFKNLGLLVIDEEQRFGVIHKEKIKQYKNNIDVLTLTATPIPRTLQMSMAGVRSLSLIETPPINRYPVQTYVLEENNQIIKESIYKELSREGQVFLLYNSVDKIESKAKEIKELIPEANVVYAHGRMTKEAIENVMIRFVNKEYNILICTTIIETGIDIPNVNTLIILDADHFGLSQLYQIRGRVGRSNKIAY
ncbi:MAG: CarD family transcriptional regulator, partial [Bacilli bacterium]|nr:CarD family transcriptional regulator [Bacilli bacterium]